MFLFLIVMMFFHWASSNDKYQLKLGHRDVLQFETAIVFYVNVSNISPQEYHLRISPVECCLQIDYNDTDCTVMSLGLAKSVLLQVNGTAYTKFAYRNLDPDRGCSPVDCAVKYRGTRNFYRNTTGKCERVVPCSTRDKKTGTVTGYYDWTDNKCVELKWLHQDDHVSNVETDAEIPVDVDPSQTRYYPDLEPYMLTEKMVVLDCNNGYQEGVHCVCHKGWVSSGIHYATPTVFHWCDQPLQTTPSHSLSNNPLYYSLITVLIVANFAMAIVWSCLCKRFGCPVVSKLWKRVLHN